MRSNKFGDYLGLLETVLKLFKKTNLHVKPLFQVLPYTFSKKGKIEEKMEICRNMPIAAAIVSVAKFLAYDYIPGVMESDIYLSKIPNFKL